MAHQMEIATATPADIAADMAAHRKTYLGFLRLLKWSSVIIAVIMAILFLSWY